MSGPWGPPPYDGQQPDASTPATPPSTPPAATPPPPEVTQERPRLPPPPPYPPPAYRPAQRPPPPAPPQPPGRPRAPLVVGVVGLALLLVMAGVVVLVALSGNGGPDRAGDDQRLTPPVTAPVSTGSDPSTGQTPSGPATSAPPPAQVIPDPDLDAARGTTTALAREFAEVINTYGPADLRSDGTMGGYRARVEALLTPRFARTFLQLLLPVETRVAGVGLSRAGEIGQVGVAVLKRMTARVVVAARITKRTDDTEPASFDLLLDVSLARSGGGWRIDDLSILTGQPGPGLSGAPGARVEPEVAAARAAAVRAAPLVLRYDDADPDGVLAGARGSLTPGFAGRFAADVERRGDEAGGAGVTTRSRPRAAGIAVVTPGSVQVVVMVRELRSTDGGPPEPIDRAVLLTMVSRGGAWLVDGVSDPSP